MSSNSAPLSRDIQEATPTLGAAVSDEIVVGEAPFAGTVSAVTYAATADVTGADTNTRTISVVNKGQDGNGTTVVATLALTAGVNLDSYDEKPLTLSATAANLDVAEGDILAFTSTHAALGLADPGGRVAVTIARADVSA